MSCENEEGSGIGPAWRSGTRPTTVATAAASKLGGTDETAGQHQVRCRMTSSKSASSQRPPSQLGSGGLAKAIGLSTKSSRPMRTTTNDQRILIGPSANGTGARKRSIGYPLCAGSVDKRFGVVKHEWCWCKSLCTPQPLDAPSRIRPGDPARALACRGRRGTDARASRVPLHGHRVDAHRVRPLAAGPANSSNAFAMGARTRNR